MTLSNRSQIKSFIAMDMLRAANEMADAGEDVIHLEVGQPGTAAPKTALAAAHKALDTDALGYTVGLGADALRERIALHYGETYGIDLSPSRVVITAGASGGFIMAFLALFDAGDTVALGSPGYPAYRNILDSLGLKRHEVPTDAESRFQPTPDHLKEIEDLKGLLIASPANPTGTMLRDSELADLIDYCLGHGVSVISDEIYHGITYGEAAHSALEYSDDVIVVNSFSKYFSMTGWRVGWLVVPEAYERAFERLSQNLFICPSALSQNAALAAFDARDELDANVARYSENRSVLLRELKRAGISNIAPPDGAFYLYADVRHLTNDTMAFCQQILNDTGVALAPGADFDPVNGHQFLRISFCGTQEETLEAAKRLKTYFSK